MTRSSAGNTRPHRALSRSPGASLEAQPDPVTVAVRRNPLLFIVIYLLIALLNGSDRSFVFPADNRHKPFFCPLIHIKKDYQKGKYFIPILKKEHIDFNDTGLLTAYLLKKKRYALLW